MSYLDSPEYQQSLNRFVAYARTDEYVADERTYKERILSAVGDALRRNLHSAEIAAALRRAITNCRKDANNLTYHLDVTAFTGLLEKIGPERLSALLTPLLESHDGLAKRVDDFKESIDKETPELTGSSRKLGLALIALLLAAYDCHKYSLYRESAFATAAKRWGIPPLTGSCSPGTKYAEYIGHCQAIRESLGSTLGRPADYIDVHSWFWTEHTDRTAVDKLVLPLRFAELDGFCKRTRNIILYGPPGTGKTWLVNHFANYFLLKSNRGEEDADQYLRALQEVQTRDSSDARTRLATLEGGINSQDPSAENDVSFWWVTANEKLWRWDSHATGPEFFSKRRVARNYESVKAGDLIFGYQSAPQKKIVAIARVVRELHTSSDTPNDGMEGVLLERVAMLDNPIPWGDIAKNPILQNSEPVRQGARGTLFALNAAEAAEMVRLIETNGNTLDFPAAPESHRFKHFVTFHQSFAYEEFVEGLRPKTDEAGQITYEVWDGVFKRCARAALADWLRAGGKDSAPKHLLLIDEINRANIAKVLGELITLLEDDKRLGQPSQLRVTLPYSGQTFEVPPNLYILGTMNTADRSIALLDIALRRRFAFLHIAPHPALLNHKVLEGVDLTRLLQCLNDRIAQVDDPDHQIGHSYLMGLDTLDDLHFVWYHRILPLLQEYFYNDGERIRSVVGQDFIASNDVSGDSTYGSSRESYRIVTLEGPALAAGLRKIAEASTSSPEAPDPPIEEPEQSAGAQP